MSYHARHASPHFAPAPIIDLNPVLHGPWGGDDLARHRGRRIAPAEGQLWERIEETADARLAALGYLTPTAVEPPTQPAILAGDEKLSPSADALRGLTPWLRKIAERFVGGGDR